MIYVAQDEPISQQDVRLLARQDGGLLLRRDAPARENTTQRIRCWLEKLFSSLGRDAPTPAVLAAVHAGWVVTWRAAALAFATVQGAHACSIFV